MAETAAPDWSPFATEPWNPEHPPFAWDADMTDCLVALPTMTIWHPEYKVKVRTVAQKSSEKVVLFFYHLRVLENLIHHLVGTADFRLLRVDIEEAHRGWLPDDEDDDECPFSTEFSSLHHKWMRKPERFPCWKARDELTGIAFAQR
jgi:hypothetical protein